MKRYQSVDEFVDSQEQWHEELVILRNLLCSTELKETIKWGFPVYTLKNKNVIGLGSFKTYVGIWFFQGSFLKDESGKLINAQEGKTKGMRQWRFTSKEELDPGLILEYVTEAIQNQKEGKEIKVVRSRKEIQMPSELSTALNESPELLNAFTLLTPGKKREYAEYIGVAKREETRVNRLKKVIPMILERKGLNDRYR